jgi:hypothetical protein
MTVPVGLRSSVAVLAVLAIGLLAGILLGTGMDQYAARDLPEESWTLWAHAGAKIFPRIMPWVFNITFLALLAAAVVNRGLARWSFGIGPCSR